MWQQKNDPGVRELRGIGFLWQYEQQYDLWPFMWTGLPVKSVFDIASLQLQLKRNRLDSAQQNMITIDFIDRRNIIVYTPPYGGI